MYFLLRLVEALLPFKEWLIFYVISMMKLILLFQTMHIVRAQFGV